jgi:hypothetical protein
VVNVVFVNPAWLLFRAIVLLQLGVARPVFPGFKGRGLLRNDGSVTLRSISAQLLVLLLELLVKIQELLLLLLTASSSPLVAYPAGRLG